MPDPIYGMRERGAGPGPDLPGALRTCPVHVGEGPTQLHDVTEHRVEHGLWLSRNRGLLVYYLCGLSIRLEWPVEFNTAHPVYATWGPLPLGGR